MISHNKKKIHIIGTNAQDINDCTREAIEKIDCSDLIILSRVFTNNFLLRAKKRHIKIVEQESLSRKNNLSLWRKITQLFNSQIKIITHLLDGDAYVDNNGFEEKNYFDKNGIDCELTPGIIKIVNIVNKSSELLTDREKNSSVTFISSFEAKEVEKILENSHFEKIVFHLASKSKLEAIWKFLRKYQVAYNYKIKFIDKDSENINELTYKEESELKTPTYIIIEKNE